MKSLNLVIPVFNEEKRICKTIETLKKGFSFSGLKLEKIIFVDDGSKDKTLFLLEKNKKELEKTLKTTVEITSCRKNHGKGYAVKKGMLASDADYTLFSDADISTPLSEIKKFIPLMKKDVPVIIGTRKTGQSKIIKAQSLLRQILGRGFTAIANLILDTKVTDFTCGFKVFSKKSKEIIFKNLKTERWGFDAEILFLAKKFDLTVKEIPVDWKDNGYSRVNLIRDLPLSFLELIKIRLNNFPFRFSSFKKTSLCPSFICK